MDCNKTINFLHEFKRLCASRDGCVADAANKERCPMFGVCDDALTRICAEYAETAIETVQKWSDEHPVKTYVQDFFEKFPKAQSYVDVNPPICRKIVYGGFDDYFCAESCDKCWNEPMEE